MTQNIDFGMCWGTPQGQDLSSPSYMASGLLVIGEAIARMWTTTRGRLIDDPEYGENITDLIGDDLSPADLQAKQVALANQAQRDERVLSCTVSLNLNVQGTVIANATVVSANGPFKLVLTVSNVTPTTLLVSP